MAIQAMRIRATRVSPHVRNTMSNPDFVTDSAVISARMIVVESRSHSEGDNCTVGGDFYFCENLM